MEVDGDDVYRDFRAHEISDIDWNPIINDMADTLESAKKPFNEIWK